MKNKYFPLILSLLLVVSGFSQVTKTIKVNSFNKLVLEGAAYFTLIPSDVNKIVVVAEDDEIMDFVKIDDKNNALTINTVSKNKNVGITCSSLKFKIYFRKINKLDFSGAGSVNSKGIIKTDELLVLLGGAGNIKIEVNCKSFTGKMNGAGSLEVIGITQKSKLLMKGVGSMKASTLVSEDTFITLNGVGYADVFANKKLTATLNGIGTINYAGDPSYKDFNINGIGSVKKLKN